MTYSAFVKKYQGKYIDFDGKFGCQCVDLMRAYVKEVHGLNPYSAIPTMGYAKDIFKNFKDNQYFKKVLNTPSALPKQGDIIFWNYYPTITGWAGHVALVDKADLIYLLTFGQNYPTNSPCQYRKFGSSPVLHGYRGVMGWLRKV
jgi:hypothetical protein